MYPSSPPTRVIHQGPLTFLNPSLSIPIASTSKSTYNPLPKGKFYVLLRKHSLHIHRGDPTVLRPLDDVEDGVEIAQVKLESRGWNVARISLKDGTGTVVELSQDDLNGDVLRERSGRRSDPPGEGSVDGGDAKRGLFGKGNLASKMRRSKSISGPASVALGLDTEKRKTEESLLLQAPDRTTAQGWVDAFNTNFKSLLPLHPLPNPSKNRSVPASASFFNIASLSTSLFPQTRSPPLDSLEFEPQSLLRPPPSTPRSRVTLTAPSPEKKQVSDWASSVRRASTPGSLTDRGRQGDEEAERNRSQSSLPTPRSHSSNSSVKSDKSGEHSSAKNRFLDGILGKKAGAKSSGKGQDLQTSFAAFSFSNSPSNSDEPSPFLPPNSDSWGITIPPPHQLSGALPIKTSLHQLPRTPKSFTSTATSDRREQRHSRSASQTDRGSISSQNTYLSTDGASVHSHGSRSDRNAHQENGRNSRRQSGVEDDYGQESESGNSSTPFLEHIISPAELISRMQGEEEEERRRSALSNPRPFTSASTSRVGRSSSMADFGAGGLSPLPRSMSKSQLSPITRSASANGDLNFTSPLSPPPRRRPAPAPRRESPIVE